MKQSLSLVLLFAGLLLYGCGSKGDSNPTSTSGGGSQPGSANVFTINLVDSDKTAARFTVAGSPPAATDVRVVISLYSTVTTTQTICEYDGDGNPIPGTCSDVPVQINTLIYKDIQDVPYSASVHIGIPVGTGYTLDVITSSLESGNHSILKYGQATNVNVSASGSQTVAMSTVNNILNMTVADSVISKGQFNVTLNDALPFAPKYTMTMGFNNGIDPPSASVVSATTNTCTFTAPTAFNAGTISLQGQFTINKSFLLKNEYATQWTRLFPNAAYSEQVYSNLSPLLQVTLTGL